MENKIDLISQLIEMAKSDNQVKEVELNFIKAIAKMLDVAEEKVDDLYTNGKEIKLVLPSSEFDRILQFHRLVLIANVDFNIDVNEIDLLKRAGLKLGLRPEAVTRVLEEMTKHPNGMIPTGIMMKLFQAYHN